MVAAGLNPSILRGKRFVRIHHGVYRTIDTDESFELRVQAALRVCPSDTAASHVTALRLHGFDIGPESPVHLSSNRRSPTRHPNIRLHRRLYLLRPMVIQGLPVLDPYRTFVDVGAQLDDRRLMWVGDWMVAQNLVDIWKLRQYVAESHLNGVQRARRVVDLIRPGVASPNESDVRWFLHRAGFPEPDINAEIFSDSGVWLARGDLVYREWKVVVEYDGWQHERDAKQRRWDIYRRESLEADGWRVIVITVADLNKPHTVIARVRQALRQRGCPTRPNFDHFSSESEGGK